MKKALLFVMVLAMIASSAIIPLSAAEPNTAYPYHPLGNQITTDNVVHAKTLSNEEVSALAKGADGTYSWSNLGSDLTEGLDVDQSLVNTEGTLSAEQKIALANSNAGISVIGATALANKPLNRLHDKVWTSDSGNDNYGASGWTSDSQLRNVYGNTTADGTKDYGSHLIYHSLLTYNFGTSKYIDYVIFASGSNKVTFSNGWQAADIYVSDNGTDWTLVSYYDIVEHRVAGTFGNDDSKEFNTIDADYLGADTRGVAYDNDLAIIYQLEGVKAKYLRFAFTGTQSYSVDKGSYEATFGAINQACAIRELFIIGGDAVDTSAKQAKIHSVQLSEVSNSSYSARISATIGDYNNYTDAGFNLQLAYYNNEYTLSDPTATTPATKTAIKNYSCNSVYQRLKWTDFSTNPPATGYFDAEAGSYFIAFTIDQIPITDAKLLIAEVTPYVTTSQGTENGDTYTITIYNGSVVEIVKGAKIPD